MGSNPATPTPLSHLPRFGRARGDLDLTPRPFPRVPEEAASRGAAEPRRLGAVLRPPDVGPDTPVARFARDRVAGRNARL